MCYKETYNILKLDFTSQDVSLDAPTVYLDLEGITEKKLLSNLIQDGWNLRLVQNKFSNRIRFTLRKNTSKICFSYHDKKVQKLFPNSSYARKEIAEYNEKERMLFLEKILDEMPFIIATEILLSNHEPKRKDTPFSREFTHKNNEDKMLSISLDELRKELHKRDPEYREATNKYKDVWAQPVELAIKQCDTVMLLKELISRDDIKALQSYDSDKDRPIISINQLEKNGEIWGLPLEEALDKASDDQLFAILQKRAEEKLSKPLYKYNELPPTEPDDVIEEHQTASNVVNFEDFMKECADELKRESSN